MVGEEEEGLNVVLANERGETIITDVDRVLNDEQHILL